MRSCKFHRIACFSAIVFSGKLHNEGGNAKMHIEDFPMGKIGYIDVVIFSWGKFLLHRCFAAGHFTVIKVTQKEIITM